MKERNSLIGNFLAFLALEVVLSGFQTAFWTHVTPFATSPRFWLFGFAYVALYRPLTQGVIFSYINTLLLAGFTNMPIGILLALHMIVLSVTVFIRKRIFWPTLTYFITTCLSLNILFSISFFLLSWSSEPMRSQELDWRELFASLVLAPLITPVVFKIGRGIDRVFPAPTTGVSQS